MSLLVWVHVPVLGMMLARALMSGNISAEESFKPSFAALQGRNAPASITFHIRLFTLLGLFGRLRDRSSTFGILTGDQTHYTTTQRNATQRNSTTQTQIDII